MKKVLHCAGGVFEGAFKKHGEELKSKYEAVRKSVCRKGLSPGHMRVWRKIRQETLKKV